MAFSDQFEIRIPSDFESGQQVVERIVDSISRAGIEGRDLFGIRLSVDEAVVNAIKHGNKLSREKSVRVTFLLNEDLVRVEIEDEGTGFRPEDVPDPTAPENLDRASGRGLMLMRQFMTKIEYNTKGNVVVLEKSRVN